MWADALTKFGNAAGAVVVFRFEPEGGCGHSIFAALTVEKIE